MTAKLEQKKGNENKEQTHKNNNNKKKEGKVTSCSEKIPSYTAKTDFLESHKSDYFLFYIMYSVKTLKVKKEIPNKSLTYLTDDKENFHCNVADSCASSCRQLIMANKGHIVRYSHSNIKRCQ